MDILTEICEKRRADIKSKGFSFGHKIPQKRIRPVIPFLEKPGTILEIHTGKPGFENAKTGQRMFEAMGRIKKICETCANWDREHQHRTIDGVKVYANCLAMIYSRWATDKCSLWKKNERK